MTKNMKKKESKKQEDDKINEEIDLKKVTDKINQGNIPSELEFYFGGHNPNFFRACAILNLSNGDANFI